MRTWSMDVSQASTPIAPLGTSHLTASAAFAILSTAPSMSSLVLAENDIVLILRRDAARSATMEASSGDRPSDMSSTSCVSQPRLGDARVTSGTTTSPSFTSESFLLGPARSSKAPSDWEIPVLTLMPSNSITTESGQGGSAGDGWGSFTPSGMRTGPFRISSAFLVRPSSIWRPPPCPRGRFPRPSDGRGSYRTGRTSSGSGAPS